MSESKVFDYRGGAIDVQWDGRLCIHIGECGNAKGDLFVGGRDPWCVPDACTVAEVREVVERCPSGALTYRDGSGAAEVPAAHNTVLVAYDGPLFVTGELAIEGAPAEAHFWLAELLTREKNSAAATTEYNAYLAREPSGPFALRARRAVAVR